MSATDIIRLCDEVLAASRVADLPWSRHPEMKYLICQNDLKWSFAEIKGNVDAGSEEDLQADYLCIAANCAPALAEYVKRLHEAAAERGIDIDTWDLPRQPR